VRVLAVAVAFVVVALGCSTGARSEDERLEDAIRALAEAGAPNRVPEAEHVAEVVCEQIRSTPTYDCYINYGEGTPPFAIFPFCAELRDGTVYMNNTREGCGPSSEGYSFRRATPRSFA
jgi:hypothetical protein